jgi:hypothetical protein
MKLENAVLLLFGANALDALFTIFWVKSGIATELNVVMASVITAGIIPFLALKILIGAFTGGVLLYGANFRLAHSGAKVALAAYGFVMMTHFFTALAALGFLS